MPIDNNDPSTGDNGQRLSLTDEQVHCVEAFLQGEPLKINAYAGTGKTTTLKALAEADPNVRAGLYLAFNRAIALEAAETFPPSVDCRTAHSLAFRALGHQYSKRLQRFSGTHVAERLKISGDQGPLTAVAFANLVIDTLNRFCHSAESELTEKHVPRRVLQPVLPTERAYLRERASEAAQTLWQLMANVKGRFPITHDVYLKLWQLSEPQLPVDYLLFDEAQDASPVMLAIVQQQTQAQTVYVGDPFQQIYSWRGAVNAMDKIDCPRTCALSQSFRFGPAVAEVANRILNVHLNANVKLQGDPAIASRIEALEQPHCEISRTNGRVVSTLMRHLKDGRKVAVVGGTQAMIMLIEGAKTLMDGRRTTISALAPFKSWDEVVEFSESDAGGDLAVLVDLLKKYRPDTLVGALKKTEREEGQAEVVLSTAHKAKGREWATVALSSDFRMPGNELYSPEESNLLYVAATRARQVLDIEHCGAVPKEKKPGKVDDKNRKAKTADQPESDPDSGPEGGEPLITLAAKEA